MRQTIRYYDKAIDDLLQIRRHYELRHSADAPDKVIDTIAYSVERVLATFSSAGRLRPEFGPEVRSYSVPPYIAFYLVERRTVWILRVLHGRRDLRRPLLSLFAGGTVAA